MLYYAQRLSGAAEQTLEQDLAATHCHLPYRARGRAVHKGTSNDQLLTDTRKGTTKQNNRLWLKSTEQSINFTASVNTLQEHFGGGGAKREEKKETFKSGEAFDLQLNGLGLA